MTLEDPYVFGIIMYVFGLISGILICIPTKRKGRYYDDK